MTNSHTPEPWKYRPNKHDDWGFIRDEKGTLVANALNSDISYEQHDEYRIKSKDPYYHNAVRIIACVNAMAGIENPEKWVKDQKQYRNSMFNSCLSIELQKRMESEEQYKNLLLLYEDCQVRFNEQNDSLSKAQKWYKSEQMEKESMQANYFRVFEQKEELFEQLLSIANGTAFDKETGLIWSHRLETIKEIMSKYINNNKTENKEDSK